MEFAVRDFFRLAQDALQTWLIVTAVVSAVTVLLFITAGWRQWRRAAARRRAVPPVSSVRADAVQELRRYAGEIAVAAERAGVTAEQRRAGWLSALRNRDAVWKAYDSAESAAARIGQASAFPVPSIPPVAEDLAGQRLYVGRIAAEVHARGALSTAQLQDVLAQRNGWEAGRHAFEHEDALRRMARDGLLRAYQAATVMERSAWQALEVAVAAKSSLDREALMAALEARQAGGGAVPARHRQHRTGRQAPRVVPINKALRPSPGRHLVNA